MTEAELRVFVAIVKNYFEQQTAIGADIYTPYLADPGALPIFDYTGVIGISGVRQGCVYFTAPADLLRRILSRSGETDLSARNLADLAGEIGNTISGNARRQFGHEFLISVPVVVKGQAQTLSLPKGVKAYVIPFCWQRLDAALVVSVV